MSEHETSGEPTNTATVDYRAPGTVDGAGPGAIELFQKNPGLAIALGAAVIMLATILTYVPAMRGDFIWDDDYYVTNNHLLRSWPGLQRIWFDVFPSPRDYPLPQYYPMTHTSFWIEYQLWGLNPTGYHVTNILLHAANALLVWLILRKLDVPGAWLAAAVFAVHPLNVESVAWIAERKNVLSGFFFFSSLYVYLRYAGVFPAPEKPSEYFALPKERERVYGLALALFVFALLSKTVTASMPVVVLLILWWKRGRVVIYEKDEREKIGFRSDLLMLAPFFVLGIFAALLTSWMEQHRVGASGPEWDQGLLERVLIAGRALWFYAYKLLVPYPLIFNYPRWEIDVKSAVQWLYPLAAAGVIVALVMYRKRLGRGPLVAVLYYVVTLFPALGFVNVFPHRYSFVADHFAYLSTVGLIALAVGAATWACVRYFPRDALASGAPAATAAGVLLVFLLLGMFRARVFAGPSALWKDTWAKNKKSWLAANNYGVYLRDVRGELDAAEQWFRFVMKERPQHAESRYNLAVIAALRGDMKAAENFYREAIRLSPKDGRARYRLGQLLVSQGRTDEAIEQFREAIAIDPRGADLAYNALGLLLARQAKYEEAVQQYAHALEINPDFIAARSNLGSALLALERVEDAVTQWIDVLENDPRHADTLNNLGRLRAMQENYNEAGVWFERAVLANPRSPDFRTNLGIAAARVGRPDVARQQFELALKLDPNYEPAKRKLEDLAAGRLKPATTQSTTAPATAPAG